MSDSTPLVGGDPGSRVWKSSDKDEESPERLSKFLSPDANGLCVVSSRALSRVLADEARTASVFFLWVCVRAQQPCSLT